MRWSALEGDGSAPLPGGCVPPPTATVKAPCASGRDWSAVEKNLAAEADEKREGGAALNDEASAEKILEVDDVRKRAEDQVSYN